MEVPTKKTVAIVFLKNPLPDVLERARTIYFQVTIDPENISPSGEFIRFGESPGDEILGWQEVELIEIVEQLAEADENGDFQPPPRAS